MKLPATSKAGFYRELVRSGEFIVSPGVCDGYSLRLADAVKLMRWMDYDAARALEQQLLSVATPGKKHGREFGSAAGAADE